LTNLKIRNCYENDKEISYIRFSAQMLGYQADLKKIIPTDQIIKTR